MSSRTPTTSRRSAMRLHTYAAAMWQTCIVQQACVISEYHNVRALFRTEAHASWQEMKQEEPAEEWRSTRACTSVAQLKEPAEACRSTRACTSMACKNHRDSKQSRNKRPLTHPSHRNNISGETSITIIRGQETTLAGRLRSITRKRLTQQMRLSDSTRRTEQSISARMQTNRSLTTIHKET